MIAARLVSVSSTGLGSGFKSWTAGMAVAMVVFAVAMLDNFAIV